MPHGAKEPAEGKAIAYTVFAAQLVENDKVLQQGMLPISRVSSIGSIIEPANHTQG